MSKMKRFIQRLISRVVVRWFKKNVLEGSMESKKWYQSKTLWFNALSIAALVIDHLSGQSIIEKETAVVILAVVNALLRTVTTKPVAK